MSLKDDPREGRPKTATTPETIEKVRDIVLDNRRVKVCEIAEAVGISEERVRNILHEELGMRKLYARWMPDDDKWVGNYQDELTSILHLEITILIIKELKDNKY